MPTTEVNRPDCVRLPERALVVEFVGAGGVGKSFLADRLLEQLRGRGLRADVFESVRLGRIGLMHFQAVVRAVSMLLSIRPSLLLTYTHSIRKLAGYVLQRRIVANIDGIHLCSDGLFQKMRGIYRRCNGTPMEDISRVLLGHCECPDVVIVVEASEETVYRRRLTRARSGDSRSRASVRSDVQLVDMSVGVIEEARRQAPQDVRMLRVNVDSEDASAAAASIADELERALREIRIPVD